MPPNLMKFGPVDTMRFACPLRLNAECLQPNNPALLLVHTDNIILRPRSPMFDPEDLDLPVASLLDRINDLLVLSLRIEFLLADAGDVGVVSNKLFQLLYLYEPRQQS